MRIEVRRVDGVVDAAAVVLALDAGTGVRPGSGTGAGTSTGTGTGDVIWLDSARPASPELTPSSQGLTPSRTPGDMAVPDDGDRGGAEDRARWSIIAAVDGPFGATFTH